MNDEWKYADAEALPKPVVEVKYLNGAYGVRATVSGWRLSIEIVMIFKMQGLEEIISLENGEWVYIANYEEDITLDFKAVTSDEAYGDSEVVVINIPAYSTRAVATPQVMVSRGKTTAYIYAEEADPTNIVFRVRTDGAVVDYPAKKFNSESTKWVYAEVVTCGSPLKGTVTTVYKDEVNGREIESESVELDMSEPCVALDLDVRRFTVGSQNYDISHLGITNPTGKTVSLTKADLDEGVFYALDFFGRTTVNLSPNNFTGITQRVIIEGVDNGRFISEIRTNSTLIVRANLEAGSDLLAQGVGVRVRSVFRHGIVTDSPYVLQTEGMNYLVVRRLDGTSCLVEQYGGGQLLKCDIISC